MMFAKKLLIAVLTTVLLLSLNACGSSSTENETDVSDLTLDYVDPAEKTDVSDSDSQTDGNGEVEDEEVGNENILIAYFTAAENSGVDAIASASYSMIDGQAVGRIRAVADMIQDKVGGELFSIQTSVVYPADGAELIDYAAEEQANNARPELITHIENLDQYDTILSDTPTGGGICLRYYTAFLMSTIFPEKPLSHSMFIMEVVFPAQSKRLRNWSQVLL